MHLPEGQPLATAALFLLAVHEQFTQAHARLVKLGLAVPDRATHQVGDLIMFVPFYVVQNEYDSIPGRQVFDGLMPLVAGERRGEFNQRFGQPSVQGTPGFGHLMPFTDDDQTDPLTGRTDGLLRRQRSLGGVAKIFSINTSAEYWRGGCSDCRSRATRNHSCSRFARRKT